MLKRLCVATTPLPLPILIHLIAQSSFSFSDLRDFVIRSRTSSVYVSTYSDSQSLARHTLTELLPRSESFYLTWCLNIFRSQDVLCTLVSKAKQSLVSLALGLSPSLRYPVHSTNLHQDWILGISDLGTILWDGHLFGVVWVFGQGPDHSPMCLQILHVLYTHPVLCGQSPDGFTRVPAPARTHVLDWEEDLVRVWKIRNEDELHGAHLSRQVFDREWRTPWTTTEACCIGPFVHRVYEGIECRAFLVDLDETAHQSGCLGVSAAEECVRAHRPYYLRVVSDHADWTSDPQSRVEEWESENC